MKKLITGSLLMLSPLVSFADDGHGCGLGQTLFEGKSGPVPHFLALTVESVVGIQTFALTSGTLGCDASQPVGASLFIEQNKEKVALDFSRGEGESLDALAQILQVEETQDFNRFVQTNFASIYSSSDASGEEVVDSLFKLMKDDEQFAKYVS
jgi:hypothetical protein